jgi:hypothetical protein
MAPYLKAALGDAAQALKIYEENTARSAALYAQLQTFEVVLRNAFDRELSAPFSGLKPSCSWFDFQQGNTSLLTGDLAEKVAAAKAKIIAKNYKVSHGQVIATLSFGFWVELTEAKYSQKLWVPFNLYKVFPGAIKRLSHSDANNFLKQFRDLRNRIAHHEPIFNRDFAKDQDSILTAIRWICPDSADWAERLRVQNA